MFASSRSFAPEAQIGASASPTPTIALTFRRLQPRAIATATQYASAGAGADDRLATNTVVSAKRARRLLPREAVGQFRAVVQK